MRAALRAPGFGLLFAGLAASMVGDSMLLLVLAVWAKSLTGSSSAAGLTLLGITAPGLVAPALGWLVDRFRRRPFLIVVNLASAGTLLPLYLVHGRAQLWLLYAVSALYGVCFVLLDAGLAGLLKALLAEQVLAEANGLLTTVRQALRLFAPLVGAGLFAAFGAGPVIAIDVASFVIAAVAVAAIRLAEAHPAPAGQHWLAEAAAGARHLVADAELRRAVFAVAGCGLAFGSLEVIAFAYVDQGLHRPPAFLGVLITISGTGGVLGGLLAPRLIGRLGERVVVGSGALALGAGTALLVYPALPLAVPALLLTGVGLPLAMVALNTLVQRRTPAELMGRAWTSVDMLVSTPWVASMAASAVLVSIVDYRVQLAVVAVALVSVGGFVWRGARRVSQPAAMMAE